MPAAAILTSEQYLALPEEFDKNGNRIKDELIAGEVVKMPPPSQLHDRTKNRISRILARFLDARPELAMEALVEIAFQVSKIDTFVSDVCVVRRDRSDSTERIMIGAPDLAIEVVSPTDPAEQVKHKIHAYLNAGSKSAWVVYPASHSIEVYAEGSMGELTANQILEDPVLPGFAAPVSEFFPNS